MPFMVDHIAQALLHSLWQIALVGLVLKIILKLISSAKADLRYGVSLFCLYLIPVLFTITLTIASPAQVTDVRLGETAANLFPDFIVLSWMIGALFQFSHLIRNSRSAYQLARTKIDPVSAVLNSRFLSLKSQMGLHRPITIGMSLYVSGPCMVGLLKPVILLPLACLTRLSSDELEAVIAHELAHIKRHDVFHSMIQSMIETMFYFHPVLSYLSKQVSIEREHACDDVAIRILKDPKPLATGLLKTGLMSADNRLIMASTSSEVQALEKRVARIVTMTPKISQPRTNVRSLVLFIIFCFVFLISSQTHNASTVSAALTKPTLISLKNEVCNQFKMDSIYWNPTYDQGGPAKVRILDGQVSMNDALLPENTQKEIKKIFHQHQLSRHDDVRFHFFGNDIKLTLKNKIEDSQRVYRLSPEKGRLAIT